MAIRPCSAAERSRSLAAFRSTEQVDLRNLANGYVAVIVRFNQDVLLEQARAGMA
jgi:hypothetical protein